MNWLAIMVATGIYFVILFFWYYPSLFGNTWLKLVGKTEVPKEKIIWESILLVGTSFVTVLILAYLLELTATIDILKGLIISLLVYAGFVLMVGINQDVFNDRTNIKLFLIEYGVYLPCFVVSGLILTLWQ
ncbi:MAG: DUF1761 family protein [Candidatus Lokiarchaeota archaeon]|nr:DUF1761 family protein [Candidatus Lokiarchaeota archaeon]MBD3202000.1 DUF1761 family protein [Candidatus Lokiarchaeota archaeon]